MKDFFKEGDSRFARYSLVPAREVALLRAEYAAGHESRSYRVVETTWNGDTAIRMGPSDPTWNLTNYSAWSLPAQPPAGFPGPQARKGHAELQVPNTILRHTCPPCDGSGRVRCDSCGGSGRKTCGSCGGDGYHSRGGMDGQGRQVSFRESCSSCSGRGKVRCGRCGGSGKVECSRCEGMGQVVKFLAVDVDWGCVVRIGSDIVETRAGEHEDPEVYACEDGKVDDGVPPLPPKVAEKVRAKVENALLEELRTEGTTVTLAHRDERGIRMDNTEWVDNELPECTMDLIQEELFAACTRFTDPLW